MPMVTIEITVGTDGRAKIEMAKNRQQDAEAAANFTKALGEAMGEITERHQGLHAHGEVHKHTHTQQKVGE